MSKYEQIKEHLKQQALSARPHTRLSSVRELMRMFGASQSPVMRAVHDLMDAGIVDCRAGVGIVAGGKVKTHVSRPEHSAQYKILYITVDYFSENLWHKEHALNLYALQVKADLIICRIQQNTDLMKLIADVMNENKIHGIVLATGAERYDARTIEFLNALKIPVVLQDCSFNYPELSRKIIVLQPDFYQTGQLAAESFIAKGHKSICFVRNEPESDMNKLRLQGFSETARKHGVGCLYLSDSVKSWESSLEAAVRIINNSIDKIRAHKISALFFDSMGGSIAALGALQRAGFQVPKDLAVIGCEDSIYALYTNPTVTALLCDSPQMGIDSIDMIIRKTRSVPRKLYPGKLIKRESFQ